MYWRYRYCLLIRQLAGHRDMSSHTHTHTHTAQPSRGGAKGAELSSPPLPSPYSQRKINGKEITRKNFREHEEEG